MAHSRTRVGVSLRVVNAENYNEKRDAISQNWTIFLEKMNAFPIFIPNTLSDIKSFLEEMEVDCLILSGGDNMGDDPERDKTENEIINFGINNQIPIFGVCRGMQVINKYFDGSTIINGTQNHVKKSHLVQLTNPIFAQSLHSESLKVNSFHNNIIKKDGLGKNLETFAVAEDETIEGFFHKNLPIMAVMWHPERDVDIENELLLMKIFQRKTLWNK